ncbi:hypothetical protein VFPPC_14519 [Pochonia chlamydosporia 170]|uniref:Uncharacterized protein n=1 Tax=Pochonia chlamydosporia 170 TaxID=1380566 RepID=A0A179FCA6_METCM|nr:hypothetical protein VFPPC_14519 [Pochonia chlamydosporia 170]OAQ63112.1 hypothetical protein VFPPC_14519 [Pochonia chlamydosporia 170]
MADWASREFPCSLSQCISSRVLTHNLEELIFMAFGPPGLSWERRLNIAILEFNARSAASAPAHPSEFADHTTDGRLAKRLVHLDWRPVMVMDPAGLLNLS